MKLDVSSREKSRAPVMVMAVGLPSSHRTAAVFATVKHVCRQTWVVLTALVRMIEPMEASFINSTRKLPFWVRNWMFLIIPKNPKSRIKLLPVVMDGDIQNHVHMDMAFGSSRDGRLKNWLVLETPVLPLASRYAL